MCLRILKLFLLNIIFLCQCDLLAEKLLSKSRHFVICTASYNNEKWAKKYLESVFSQNYKKFRVVYYDDCSTDKTLDIVKKFVKDHNVENKIHIVHNSSRVGPHENYFHMLYSKDAPIKDSEIVIINDGDDWLANNHVLSQLADVYANPDVWITYGQFKVYPSGTLGCSRKIPDKIIEQNDIRSYKWVTSHLRTFYAWLYRQIKFEDFFFNGQFVKRAGDVAIMIPMIEMAGKHSRFISEILLVYNCANENHYGKPLGDAFASLDERKAVENEIRKKRPKYQPLEVDKTTAAKLCGFDK
jgi:glycosyltransferase involved in cell wall biosynthesis